MIDLWYRLDFQEGVVNKLSNVPPYHQCQITIRSTNEAIKKFICRATFNNERADKDTGTLIAEYDDRPALVDLQFTLNAITQLIPMGKGDGVYKISFYAQNNQDVWNELYILFAVNTGIEMIKTSDNKALGTNS